MAIPIAALVFIAVLSFPVVSITLQCSHRVLLKSTCAFLCFFFDQPLFYVLFCAFFGLEVLILGK